MKNRIEWISLSTETWSDFLELDLNDPWFKKENGEWKKGVYLIWSDEERKVVRVGSGEIRVRLDAHKKNTEIKKHTKLRVVCAEVTDEKEMLGIENYLAYIYTPVIGDAYPNVKPIEVFLPQIDASINNPESPYNSGDTLALMQYYNGFGKWARVQHGDDFAAPFTRLEELDCD